MEIELGDFFNKGGEDEEMMMDFFFFFDNTGHWKSGLRVEEIEIRPRELARIFHIALAMFFPHCSGQINTKCYYQELS